VSRTNPFQGFSERSETMKSSHWGLVLLAFGLVVGMLVGGGVMDRSALAQGEKGAAAQPQTARFQISAWSYAGNPSIRFPSERGCYIVDTVTGELWHAAADGQPKKISEKLR
jgi:hypothetical protein